MKNFTKIISSVLFILSLTVSTYAQKVVLCSDYTSNGTPSGIYTEWDINPSGGFIYILYNQPSYISTRDTWHLYIDKDWDDNGKYSAYETIPLTPNEGKKWIVYDYKFTEKGKYIVSIQKNGIEQAQSFCRISFKSNNTDGNSSNDDDDSIDTYYYEYSEIKLCTNLDSDNKPLDESTEFQINRETGNVKVKIFLSNDAPLKTDKLNVSIYKGADSKSAYKEYTVDIQPEWDYVSFNNTFTEPGTYFIDIYTKNGIYINTSSEIIITR